MFKRSFDNVRLDALPTSSRVLLVFLFAASFPVAYELGSHAPPIHLTLQSQARFSNQNESRWVEDLPGMDRINQEFSLRAEISNRRYADFGMVKQIEVDVTLWGSRGRDEQFTLLDTDAEHKFSVTCDRGEPLCEWVTLLHVPSIEWRTYRAIVSMRGLLSENEGEVLYTFTYGNPQFSLAAMVVKYAFLLLALQRGFAFYTAVARHGQGEWTTDRKMGLLLLAGLVAFNDPLYMLRLVWGGFLFPLLALVGQVTFSCVALLYALVVLDGFLQNLKVLTSQYEMEPAVTIAPKVAVVGALWAAQCVVAVLVRLNQVEDPMYRASVDLRGFLLYKAVSLVLLGVAVGWYAYIVLRTLGEIADIRRTVGVHTGESAEVASYRSRFYFVAAMFSLALFAVAAALVLWYVGAAGLPGNNAAEWVAFTVFFNVFGLVCVYALEPAPYARLVHDNDLL